MKGQLDRLGRRLLSLERPMLRVTNNDSFRLISAARLPTSVNLYNLLWNTESFHLISSVSYNCEFHLLWYYLWSFLYNFMFVSDLTNHSVRSGVDLLLSLLTIPQKLHSRQYGIHSKRMNTHVNSSWVSRHLGEGKVSSCFYMILGWTRLMSIVFSLGKSFALIPQCVPAPCNHSRYIVTYVI